MIIDWTYTAFTQLQNYYGLGYIQTYSGGVFLAFGWVHFDGISFYAE